MGLLRRVVRWMQQPEPQHVEPEQPSKGRHPLAAESTNAEDEHEPSKRDVSWYVAKDGDEDRFLGLDGMPPLHLIRYRDWSGELVLRLCEDATGLLVSPSDRRLPKVGIYIYQLRGEYFHQTECQAGNFWPGAVVRLVREPNCPADPNAVAVCDLTGQHAAAYVPKQKAKTLAKLIDSGVQLEAISIRGTQATVACVAIAILAARPDVLKRLQEPRPKDLPVPAHERT